MNRFYLLLLFALAGGVLAAQSEGGELRGIFDLSYGMAREEAIATLTSQGFQYGRGQTAVYCMYPAPADTLAGMRVTLYFYDPGTRLSGWDIRFPLQDAPELEQNVIQVLTDLHGDGINIFSSSEHSTVFWYPDDYHVIKAYFDEDDGCFWVFYTHQKPEEDDDYWDD